MIDLQHDERLFTAELLKFKLPADDPKASRVAEDRIVRWNGRKFYMQRIKTIRQGAEVLLDVECEALWYRLSGIKKVGSYTLTAVTRAAGLTDMLTDTGWSIGLRTNSGAASATLYSLETQDASVLSIIREWAKVTNTYPVFDTDSQTVDLLPEYGVDRGIGFRYGRNLTSVEREAQPPACTRLWPYGRDGLDISGVSDTGYPYLTDFSFYTAQGITSAAASALYLRDEVWSDPSFISDTALLAAAQARLTERAQASAEYRLSVIDLSALTGVTDMDDLHVGDSVRVQDPGLGVDVRTVVTRLVRFPLEPWRNQIELSTQAPTLPNSGTTARPSSALSWELFLHEGSLSQLRNEGTYIVNRISLAFAGAAEAIYGHTVTFTGVGTGSLNVSALDAENDALIHPVRVVPYTHGEVCTSTLTMALQDLNGQKDYRIRMKAVPTSSSGATASGINIDAGASNFWIMARGAVQRTPKFANSQRFDYTGAVQTFTVPDGVSEITVECVAAAGGMKGTIADEQANGGSVTASFVVLPGAVYDVYVGGHPNDEAFAGGWPNGGDGDTVSGASGYGGGGRSEMRPTAAAIAAALIVAGAGGGGGQAFTGARQRGGAGGFFAGAAAFDNSTAEGGPLPGGGATQFTGGVQPGGGGGGGGPGSQGQGGVAANSTNAFNFPAGGGGDGWYGGAGGGTTNLAGSGQSGGGGGGSGYVAPAGFDISFTDAINDGHGYVVVSWETPI